MVVEGGQLFPRVRGTGGAMRLGGLRALGLTVQEARWPFVLGEL